jgi:hypothetical protein
MAQQVGVVPEVAPRSETVVRRGRGVAASGRLILLGVAGGVGLFALTQVSPAAGAVVGCAMTAVALAGGVRST